MGNFCWTRRYNRESLQGYSYFLFLHTNLHISHRPAPFLETANGQVIEKRLYAETMAEMREYVAVSPELIFKAFEEPAESRAP